MAGALVRPHGAPAVSVLSRVFLKNEIHNRHDKLPAHGALPVSATGHMRVWPCSRRTIQHSALVHRTCRDEFASLHRMRLL